ncbi:hypothetical protein SUGI_0216320 [Cryptomeria japonica]|nr:hypothetical protein SUGI_0216320 [Cryptomeria japonica]
MDRNIKELTKFQIQGSPNVMHLNVHSHVLSQKEGTVPNESIAELNEGLMSSLAQLSFNYGMPLIQAVEPPVYSIYPLYDQLDLSWVERKFQSMLAQIYSQMPRFHGFNICEGNAHIQSFYSFMKKHSFREEDVCMRFFVRTLNARAKDWYLGFPKKSFACWGELVGAYMERIARELIDLVKELSQIRRQDEETSIALSHRFASTLSQIPEAFRPKPQLA